MQERSAAVLFAVALLSSASLSRARADETIVKTGSVRGPVSDGGLYLGLGGGLSPDTQQAGTIVGLAALDRPLFWRIGLWISGEWTYLMKAPDPDFALRLCFGLRGDLYRSEHKAFRIISTLSFAHQHEATTAAWRDHPFSNLFGESKDGLGHRSGIEGGLGFIVTPLLARDGFARRLRLLVRAGATWLPDDKGPNLFLGFTTSVGIAI